MTAMMSVACSACLIGPVDPTITREDVNHWPHIVLVDPDPGRGVLAPTYCTTTNNQVVIQQSFDVDKIVEYDLEQTLYVRWFFDYDPERADPIRRFHFAQQELPGQEGGELVRDARAVEVPSGWVGPGTEGDRHFVEVVVADRDWDDVGGELPNRTPLPGGLVDTYVWVIENLTHTGSCP